VTHTIYALLDGCVYCAGYVVRRLYIRVPVSGRDCPSSSADRLRRRCRAPCRDRRTRTEQETTRSSDPESFLLESVFRRIPSPKCASALLHNGLVLRYLLIRSGMQSGGRAAAIPFYHGYHRSWSCHRRYDFHSGRSLDHLSSSAGCNRSILTTPVCVVHSLMQLSEMCDAIRRDYQYGHGATFASGRKWAVNAPPACGTLRHIMVTILLNLFWWSNRFPLFCTSHMSIENPELRSNKPNPAPSGDPTMAETPVVPLLLPNSIIVQVKRQSISGPIKARQNFLLCEKTTVSVAMTRFCKASEQSIGYYCSCCC
jgi:hypothetical protein